MDLYYVNSEVGKAGKHEIHKVGCDHFPLIYVYLGLFSTQKEAMERAQSYFPKVELCPDCCVIRPKRVFFNPR